MSFEFDGIKYVNAIEELSDDALNEIAGGMQQPGKESSGIADYYMVANCNVCGADFGGFIYDVVDRCSAHKAATGHDKGFVYETNHISKLPSKYKHYFQ